MSHANHLSRQDSILAKTLDILKASANVLGVAAKGSYAQGSRDAFSDLDVTCFLRDAERTSQPELHASVGGIAPTLSVLYLYKKHALYLFENGVRLDLDYARPSDLDTPDSESLILYDPDGILKTAFARNRRANLPSHPHHFEPGREDLIDWFFWMLRQAYCWILRGAQADHRAYTKLAAAADSLAQIRSTLVQMRLWTLGSEPFYILSVDRELADALSRTFPHLEPDEMLIATRRLLECYEVVAPDYCHKAGLSFPARKCVALWKIFGEFDKLAQVASRSSD